LRRCVANRHERGWLFQEVARNHYTFINQASGLCLDAQGPAADWTPMTQHACTGISNEEFNAGAKLPDVVFLESRIGFRDSRFCVEPPGNTGIGSQVYLFGCLASIGQRWTIDS